MTAAPGTLEARVVSRLAAIPGVVAVALGGSRARGDADTSSDFDFGVYYSRAAPPEVGDLQQAAADLDDGGEPEGFGAYGEWGPWINGGAWLHVEGTKTDFLLREIERVTDVVHECRAGRSVAVYQPGHPHAFHSHIYMGELHHNVLLHDPTQQLATLQAATAPYPLALAAALARDFSWEAGFAVDTAETAAERGDVAYVAGSLFRAVSCLVQVLFALNEQYFLNEKGAVARVDTFSRRPARFASRVALALGGLGTSDALGAARESIGALAGEVTELADAYLELRA